MKMKLLPLFLIVVMVFSAAQPIYAEADDSEITGPNYNPLQDIIINAGTCIQLHAKLLALRWWDTGGSGLIWLNQPLRYLNFYVYNANANGTNGDLVWSDGAYTSYFNCIASPNELALNERGNYNLLVTYKGGWSIKPCNATAKIKVV